MFDMIRFSCQLLDGLLHWLRSAFEGKLEAILNVRSDYECRVYNLKEATIPRIVLAVFELSARNSPLIILSTPPLTLSSLRRWGNGSLEDIVRDTAGTFVFARANARARASLASLSQVQAQDDPIKLHRFRVDGGVRMIS